MKIMVIAPGRSIHSNNWASAMCDRGHEVYFVTQESFTSNQYSFIDNIDKRLIVKQLPFKGKKGFLLNAFAVKKLTKEINPDIIHVHQAVGYGFLGTFSDREKAFISVYGWEVYQKVKSKIWKLIIGYILHWYKHIGSTSHCMRDQIYKIYPDLHTPIVVTPFGIDMNVFHYQEVSKNGIIVGMVKKMNKQYGVECLIKAFEKSFHDVYKYDKTIAEQMTLELVGPGDDETELKEIAKNTAVSDRIIFVGRVMHNEVPNYLNRFDLYCAPSLETESFGVAVIEASACRRPVIVSNVGGLPEVVQNGITGIVVEAKNVDKLSKAITKLVLNRELREQMGLAGESLVKEKYDWQICVDQMEDVYRSILSHTFKEAAEKSSL